MASKGVFGGQFPRSEAGPILIWKPGNSCLFWNPPCPPRTPRCVIARKKSAVLKILPSRVLTHIGAQRRYLQLLPRRHSLEKSSHPVEVDTSILIVVTPQCHCRSLIVPSVFVDCTFRQCVMPTTHSLLLTIIQGGTS